MGGKTNLFLFTVPLGQVLHGQLHDPAQGRGPQRLHPAKITDTVISQPLQESVAKCL